MTRPAVRPSAAFDCWHQKKLLLKAGIHLSHTPFITRNLSLVNIEKLAAALSMKLSELFVAVERA